MADWHSQLSYLVGRDIHPALPPQSLCHVFKMPKSELSMDVASISARAGAWRKDQHVSPPAGMTGLVLQSLSQMLAAKSHR